MLALCRRPRGGTREHRVSSASYRWLHCTENNTVTCPVTCEQQLEKGSVAIFDDTCEMKKKEGNEKNKKKQPHKNIVKRIWDDMAVSERESCERCVCWVSHGSSTSHLINNYEHVPNCELEKLTVKDATAALD